MRFSLRTMLIAMTWAVVASALWSSSVIEQRKLVLSSIVTLEDSIYPLTLRIVASVFSALGLFVLLLLIRKPSTRQS